jgi:hypothetical protein
MSFASIMGIREDLNLRAQLVGKHSMAFPVKADPWLQYSWLTTCIYIAVLIVEYPINWTIQ